MIINVNAKTKVEVKKDTSKPDTLVLDVKHGIFGTSLVLTLTTDQKKELISMLGG